MEEEDWLFLLDLKAYIKEGRQAMIGFVSHKRPDYLMEFWDLFSEKEFDQLPKRRPCEYAIELMHGLQPCNCKTAMFFGLTNLPATCQSMMNEILRDLIDGGHVLVYLDDILIFTTIFGEH